eukprot:3981178-Prymnesium_polylepis.1
MRGAGIVTVELVPTAINPTGLFTKILSPQVFEKHRKTVLNLSANAPRPHAPRTDTPPNTWLQAGSRGGQRGTVSIVCHMSGGTCD